MHAIMRQSSHIMREQAMGGGFRLVGTRTPREGGGGGARGERENRRRAGGRVDGKGTARGEQQEKIMTMMRIFLGRVGGAILAPMASKKRKMNHAPAEMPFIPCRVAARTAPGTPSCVPLSPPVVAQFCPAAGPPSSVAMNETGCEHTLGPLGIKHFSATWTREDCIAEFKQWGQHREPVESASGWSTLKHMRNGDTRLYGYCNAHPHCNFRYAVNITRCDEGLMARVLGRGSHANRLHHTQRLIEPDFLNDLKAWCATRLCELGAGYKTAEDPSKSAVVWESLSEDHVGISWIIPRLVERAVRLAEFAVGRGWQGFVAQCEFMSMVVRQNYLVGCLSFPISRKDPSTRRRTKVAIPAVMILLSVKTRTHTRSCSSGRRKWLARSSWHSIC